MHNMKHRDDPFIKDYENQLKAHEEHIKDLNSQIAELQRQKDFHYKEMNGKRELMNIRFIELTQ